MKSNFVHLHVHTEYSLLDGLSKIDKLIHKVKETKMDTVAITDHGVMYGALEFYKKSIKEGVKPIIGMEGYITDGNISEKSERQKNKNYHILLLAQNNSGYKNLMKLSSIAHLEGFYYKPRIDKLTLQKYSQGIICTSGCALGIIPQLLLNDDYGKAKEEAEWFANIFKDNFYLEIQKHEYKNFTNNLKNNEIKNILTQSQENEELINESLIKLSRELGIGLLATNDVHYVDVEDASAQDALVCISTGKKIDDMKRMRYIDAPTFYLRTPDEMINLFSKTPDAIENSIKIGDKCNIELVLNKWFFPVFPLEKNKTSEEKLEDLVWIGAKLRFYQIDKEIRERLIYEMDIIKNKGYATYFLIVSDMANWAKENGIITNTRGSAAGSLVSYCMGIININPLDYNLPFERFLTPWRPSPPDIDFDIADNRREEVIKYITEKYGVEKVAQICTFGRMLARGSVRDIARVLGYPYATGDKIAKLIPMGSQGFPMTLKKALQESIELKTLYENDKDTKTIMDLSMQVEGNARHISVHAAGVVIAPEEITNFTPIQLDPEGKKVITQYDMDALDPNVSAQEAVGLLKFDLLGLRNLSILGESINLVKNTKNIDISLTNIPVNDEKTYTMLSKGETMGVFQLSGSGMTRYLKELKPTRIEDLMVMVALYRPGPMAQIPEYIDRKNNPSKVKYFDERMKQYLDKSYGLMVYQDDVFMTAIKIAGYSWEEADKFRKAVGKKIPQEMEKQKEKFIRGSIHNGLGKSKAEELFRLIEPFSGYGFNKAHAASYGMLAYFTAYMKANYPVEYMCSLLTAESLDTDKITQAINECRRMGIEVLSPDINQSVVGFNIVKDNKSLNNQAIRFGLNAIKNVGIAAIEAILEERSKSTFKNMQDFLIRVDTRKVNKKVVESLIKVGALSQFGKRSALLSSYEKLKNKLSERKKDANQSDLFSSSDTIYDFGSMVDDIYDVEEFSEDEIENLERQLLGFSLTSKPVFELIEPYLSQSTHTILEISDNVEDFPKDVNIAAVLSELRIITTKKTGSQMAFGKIFDGTGSLDIVVFPSVYASIKEIIFINKAYIFEGRIGIKDDEYNLIVSDIRNSPGLNTQGKTLYINIPTDTTLEKLKELKKVLSECCGDNPVVLVFQSNHNKQFITKYKINWNESIAKIITGVLGFSEYRLN